MSNEPPAHGAEHLTAYDQARPAVRRRVLMLNFEFPPIGGGSGNATAHLLREFASDGDLDVDLVTSSEREFRVEPFSARIRIHRLAVGKRELLYWRADELFRYSWQAYRYAQRLLRTERFDLCHCWSGWPPGFIGHLLRRRVPYLVALRGSDVPGYSPRLQRLDGLVFRRLSRRVWSDAAALVANSSDLRTLAWTTGKHDIDVIPNGVDTERFAPGDRAERPDAELALLFVGRFVRRKNVSLLLRALARVQGCTLTLVGEGPCAPELRRLVGELGLEARVRFLGHVPHESLSAHYRSADAFVLPSDREGMSNSLLEALASGLAVVATDTGGAADLVGQGGIVVPPGELEPLVSALDSLVRHPELVERMRAEARRQASGLSWSSVATRYREIYERCAARPLASRRSSPR